MNFLEWHICSQLLRLLPPHQTDEAHLSRIFNPRRAGAQKLPWSAGGGASRCPPHLTRLLGVVARNEKNVRKLIKNHFKTISVTFPPKSIMRSPEVIKGQRTKIVAFFYNNFYTKKASKIIRTPSCSSRHLTSSPGVPCKGRTTCVPLLTNETYLFLPLDGRLSYHGLLELNHG